ncbi:cysteine sulfinate desulfinase [Enterocytozoon bieneusi H348]|nr:cysteine sulfinate desulfinase [Enterocytozoon bieneusi H348]|eukprot:XP_001827769.1 cysteine sulfinate desulfinase [Enterocytozoon bieneusi H348]
MLEKILKIPSEINYTIPSNYFDSQATTPIDPRVINAMIPFMTTEFGNPHSRTHSFGWNAEKAMNESRKIIANIIGADSKDIIFTSGATEANNLALKGVAEYYNNKLHIITQQTEHKAVLETCRYLEDKGVEVTYLPVNKNGKICLKELQKAIKPNTKLVSIMAVNNEIGVKQPIEEIGKICQEHGIIFHTDAAQGFGKIPIDVKKANIGMMSISGHKIYGPKGIGALYVRRNPRVRLIKQLHGGDQERGLRSGTTPTFLAVGFGKAAQLANDEMEQTADKITKLNSKFLNILTNKLGDGFIKNGHDTVPDCLNLSFPFVEGESLLMKLKDFALSSGSACTSASLEPSYVLRALGTSEDLAHSSIRFGFNKFNDETTVKQLAEKTANAVISLREMSPLYEMVKSGIDLSTIKWSA